MDQQALADYRYRAVREVLEGSQIGEIAQRYGTSRLSLDAWRKRFLAEGMPGLTNRSRRPKSSPARMPAELEALVCQIRREQPQWGARRIVHELGQRGIAGPPGRATVHRVLVRNGLVGPQDQEHKRRYRRWQRDAPMQLWQLDIVGGVPLASGRDAKLVTGIDLAQVRSRKCPGGMNDARSRPWARYRGGSARRRKRSSPCSLTPAGTSGSMALGCCDSLSGRCRSPGRAIVLCCGCTTRRWASTR